MESSTRKRKVVKLIAALCGALFVCPLANSESPFPRLLPPADDFRLTLVEGDSTTAPPGPSCSGEAGLTLTCRPFILRLENRSKKAVRLSGDCVEPPITIERKESVASDGWWTVSRPSSEACRKVSWSNTRLAPGEITEVKTRLISLTRDADALLPGPYTLRARWTLFGCTEPPDGSDCLAPLQATPPPPSTASGINFQEPITLVSNELLAQSPSLPFLGEMKFSFDVTVRPGPPDSRTASHTCTPETSKSVVCAVFHYTIGNSGARPIRFSRLTCSFSAIAPEYRVNGAEWNPLREVDWLCASNVRFETAILPGRTVEGEFTLPTLRPGYITRALPPGEYEMRFLFLPRACVASPDGRFCITETREQPPVASREIALPLR